MRSFPQAVIVIDSPLAPLEAEAALRAATVPWGRSDLDPGPYAFEGEVTALRIDIQRAARPSRSAPRVQIRGRIVPHAGGCRLMATADLPWTVHAGMLAWTAFLVIGWTFMTEGSAREMAPLLALLVIGWLAQWLLFMHQVHIVRGILITLLNGVLVDEEHREAAAAAMDREPMPA